MGCHTWYYTKAQGDPSKIINTLRSNAIEYHKAQAKGDKQAVLDVFNKQLQGWKKELVTFIEEDLPDDTPKEILQAISTLHLYTLETSDFFTAANEGAIWNWEVNDITYTTHPDKDILMIEEESIDYPVRFYHYPQIDTLICWEDVLLLLEEYRIFGYHLPENNLDEKVIHRMYEGNLEALEQWFKANPDGYISIG
jgi:hypothetical protein